MCRHVGWGKLRARRGMVGAMLPRARELLKHLCQIGALAGGGAAVRTRARRAKRLLKARALPCCAALLSWPSGLASLHMTMHAGSMHACMHAKLHGMIQC
jgi:hypothetical protein